MASPLIIDDEVRDRAKAVVAYARMHRQNILSITVSSFVNFYFTKRTLNFIIISLTALQMYITFCKTVIHLLTNGFERCLLEWQYS